MEKVSKNHAFFHPLSRRLHLMLLLMTGFFCMAYMRNNLGMTMTCMVNSTAVALNTASQAGSVESNATKVAAVVQAGTCALREGIENDAGVIVNNYGGDLVWDSQVQNLLFAGTFWGALLSNLPAGYLADRTSPVNMLVIAAMICSATSIMFPLVSIHLGYELAFVTRILMGLGEGLIVPSVNSMISRWVPTHEKSTAASIFTIGNQLSGALGVPISAAFCASKFKWPGAYYSSAIAGILWAVIWRLSVTNTPAKTKVMTKAERMYLERTLDNIRFTNKADRRVPWRAIFTSPAVLACFFSNFACNCIVVILVAYQPTFFKEILLLPMIDNGIFSALPHVIQIVVKLFWSITVDYLKRKHISNTTACKVSQGFASAVIGICLVLLAHFSDCQNPMVGIVIFCALAGGCATVIAGFYTSLLTLAPAYTGTLSSISMTVGIIGMAITPQLVGFFRVQGTIEEWRKIFYVLASLVVASGVTFVAFASGEAQPWGRMGPTTVKATLHELEQKKKPLLKPTELSEKSLMDPEV